MKIRIKHKLFFTLLLTSVVVATGMFLFMQWSFDRGFLNYVNSQELEQLDRLADRLSSNYAEQGSWQFLHRNPLLWRQMLEQDHRLAVGTSPPQQGPRAPFHREPPSDGSLPPGMAPPLPPPKDPGGIGPRVVLFDATQKKIIGGPPEPVGTLQLHPIYQHSEVIGFLALIPARELSDAGDLLFVEQQTESLALVALVMVAFSLLLSVPLASHLLRPIKQLTEGTRSLIAGRFKTRITITSKDELGQLSADFNSLAMTLEKNEQARQQWVADISHELRTPLSVLRGDIEALQDGIRSPEPQTFAALHGETMHLGRLVDDLYELSMSDIGALNYKKITVDPIGILRGTLELFESRFVEKKLRLRSELPIDQPISLLADPDRLQQLFTNLLENSVRYTDAHGELMVRMWADKRALFFSFDDSAPGVSTEQRALLFERLYRVEASRNRSKGGAGLGLAICSNIVEAHQGEIEVDESELGGLKITIKFPLSA